MGRRRKTSSSAETEKADTATRRSQRTKEALTEENSTDGMEEEAGAKALRSTRGRSKGDSSNGDVEQEEAAGTRRLRRSSRSASVEKDKVRSAESRSFDSVYNKRLVYLFIYLLFIDLPLQGLRGSDSFKAKEELT